MTASPERIADYVDLIDFISSSTEIGDAKSTATRIGVADKIRYRESYTKNELWGAVLEAALIDRCIERFLAEVEKVIGEARRPGLEAAKRTCAEAQYKTIMRQKHPELFTVSMQLPRARSLGELDEAGKACRGLVLRILSAVEAGAPERSMLLFASSPADVDRLAERIGTYA